MNLTRPETQADPTTPAETEPQVTRPIPKRVRKLLADALYTGPSVRADQLVGLDSCLRQLNHQIKLLERPAMAERMGLEPSGTLFIGAPGTGKTHAARFLAGQLDMPLYQMSADQFDGEPKMVHEVFRALGPQRALLFIDEISILAQKREWSDHPELLSALLTSLDGLATRAIEHRLWVIGACTPDIHLDPAVYRSGRLGVVVEFTSPSQDQRAQLFELYLQRVPHTIDSAAIARLAEVSPGATGADINDWVNQAAAEAIADDDSGEPVIRPEHMEIVVARRGYIAAERPGREPTLKVAIHEAAHAVIAYVLFGADALSGVTVRFGRGRSVGDHVYGHFQLSDDWLAENDANSRSWPDHAALLLAGACAEQAVLGYRSSGSGNDVAGATALIVEQFDRADAQFGPSWSAIEHAAGYDDVVGPNEMRATAWTLARLRFDECWDRTVALVKAHRPTIEHLATALLEAKSTLTGEEIVDLLGSFSTEGGLGHE
jgi:ATP-dependent Zn protease